MRQRDIFLFWLPLFASWLLMTAEGPVVSAAINRLPDEVVMLAAMGIVTSLSITIESPIINLLATSTALSRDHASFLLIRRFTMHWMVALTVVAFAVAFTPLFDLIVLNWLAVPARVAFWVRPGLRIMVLWSAAIGWRRFLQGIMIRFNQTRKVAWGTAVRLASSAGTVLLLASISQWPGVVIGSTALMAGVISEAIYATIAVRPLLRGQLGPESPAAVGAALTYGELLRFHLPLAATSLLVLMLQPMVAFSLARLPEPTLSLAAWPIVFQILLIFRAPAMALPEAVIALTQGELTFRPIRHFTRSLVMANSAAILLFVLTPLASFYLFQIQDTTLTVGRLARSGLAMAIPLPALALMVSWIRGLLIDRRATRAVNAGMAVNLTTTATVLGLGVLIQLPGIPTAAAAMTLAMLAEFLFLWWRVGYALDFRFVIFESSRQAISG